MTAPISDVPMSNNTNPRWWRDAGLRRLYFLVACIMTAQYDETVVGSFQAMAPWISDMGHPNSSRVGIITAMVFIGGFVGSLPAPWMSDRLGRRWSMFIGAAFTLAGTIVSTAARGSKTFIGGRFLLGIGISLTNISGPNLVIELAHPRNRGVISASYNVLFYVGSIVAAWTCFGMSFVSSTWAWRLPSLLQGVPAIFLMIMTAFIPESPRFLVAHGRIKEAHKILARYHANGDLDDELVRFELQEITTALNSEKMADKMGWEIMVATAGNRRRTVICVTVACLCIWSGQGLISYYFSEIMTGVGITGATRQTGINGGLQIWNLLVSILGVCLTDHLGRRPLWLLSLISMMLSNIALTVATARYDATQAPAAGIAAMVFVFMYDASFNIACNPLPYSYVPEILPYGIRAKGLSIVIGVAQAGLVVNQYVNPIALDHIGWRYYIFYLGLLLFFATIVYFIFPETKGMMLEEVAVLLDGKGAREEILQGVETAKGGVTTTVVEGNEKADSV